MFIQCGRRGFVGTDGGKPIEIGDVTWGDENDHYCVAGGRAWYASAGATPSICEIDLTERTVISRVALDASWASGSVCFWRGDGVIAVEAPMSGRLGLIYPAEASRTLQPVTEADGSIALGFHGTALVLSGDIVSVLNTPACQVIRTIPGLEGVYGMAVVGGRLTLVGSEGVFLVDGDLVERVLMQGVPDAIVYRVVPLGAGVALVLDDQTVCVCSVER